MAAVALGLTAFTPPADAVPDRLTLDMYVLPVNAKVPTLSELQRHGVTNLESSLKKQKVQADPGRIAGPSAALLRDVGMDGIPAQTHSVQGATYPDPPRSITNKECQKNLNNSLFYVKSRFAMCGALQFLQVWGKNGRPVGESSFALMVRGTIPDARDRTVHFDYNFSNFSAAGNTKTSGLIVNTEVTQKVLVSQAKKRESGLIPPKKSFNALRAAPNYTHNVIFDAGQGTKPDDLISMAYVPYVSVKYPPEYVAGTNPGPQRVTFAGMNWDAASYLPNSRTADPKKRGGASFAYKVALPYSSTQGAPEKAVADHLKLAHTQPSKTKPPNPHKSVPGFDPDHPLHRLYRDKSRYRANRRTAVSVCVKYWGKDYATSDPAGPRECDEYPFASTYEGAAQSSKEPSAPKNNYSALPIPKAQNKAGGTILALFYDKNRILDGRDAKGQEVDAYLMAIK
ncbi:hypothetical protein ACFY0R_40365 [Streptomyces sp. NPDC001633]|uniref:NucA/NucB deoxyribonuclease domain-containing protein n=1 Tax=Streptomyces sp. NPDC001633 TaxID=3364595 RepID=UPI0036C94FE1